MAQLRLHAAGGRRRPGAQSRVRAGVPRRLDDLGPAVPRRGDAAPCSRNGRDRRGRELERLGSRPRRSSARDAQRTEQLRLATRIADRFARAVLAAADSRVRAVPSSRCDHRRWRPCARRARATATTPAACWSRIEDGRVKHVRGDPEHHVARGKLCRKCSIGYNGAFIDPELRLTTPLRRVGPKGEGRFEPIDWPDATSAIAAACTRSPRRTAPRRPQRALHRHVRADRHGVPAALLQPPRRDRGRAGHRLQQRRARGAQLRLRVERGGLRSRGRGRRPMHRRVGRESLGERAARARPLAARGARPGGRDRSDPHSDRGAGGHLPPAAARQRRRARVRARARDPSRRPGRRGVRARARARLRRAEPLLERCTPAWAEEHTGVPASLIEHVARVYGRGPSLLWMGQGLQRQPRGGNVMRAIAMLPALTGNVRRPGSGFLYLNGSDSRGVDSDWLTGAELARAGCAGAISQMDLAACSPIRIAAARSSAGTSTRSRRARSRPPCALRSSARTCSRSCAISSSPTQPPTPTTSCPRRASWRATTSSPRTSTTRSRRRSRPWSRRAHALRNAEIFRRLAAGMGFDEQALQEGDAALIEQLLASSGVSWDGARARRHRAALSRAARAVRRRLPDAERAHRARLGERRGRWTAPRFPSRASTSRRPWAACGCSHRPRPGS